MIAVLAYLPLVLAALAIGYTVHASVAVRSFAGRSPPPPATAEPISLLKPLHGAEPCLAANLRTFLAQDWPAPVELVCGTNRADDPALAIAAALAGEVVLRSAAPPLGANAKVANLANLLPAARHDLLVMSDSDIAVPPDYLSRVAATLALPGVGAATCLYHGRGDAGFPSRFAAAAITYQFEPSAVMSDALGVHQPCLGSTIAMRRATLERIGGFAAFADVLADDHAIGRAVIRAGLRVALVPGLSVAHGCVETSLAEVWRHERRWAATVRGANLLAHVGSLLTHPLALALLAIAPTPRGGLVAVAAALLARWLLASAIARWIAEAERPPPWLPLRDLFSFAVFVASFFARSVDWRGSRLTLANGGRIAARPEILS